MYEFILSIDYFYTLKGLSSAVLLKMRDNRRKLRSAGLQDNLFADIAEELHDTLKLIFGVYLDIVDISTHDLEVWIDKYKYIYIYIYTRMYRKRERERERKLNQQGTRRDDCTVSEKVF